MFENALTKLVILRPDLCVGVAGSDPVGAVALLSAHRSLCDDDLTELLSRQHHAAFLVAALEPSALLRVVRSGNVEDRTALTRAWIGDEEGYDMFQASYHQWPSEMPDGFGEAFKLLASMQWVIEHGHASSSIGGYHTRVASGPEGFRFVADRSTVWPDDMDGIADLTQTSLRLRMSTRPGVDPAPIDIGCVVGSGRTFGALAYFLKPHRPDLPAQATLFPHERPFEPISFRCESVAELVNIASSQYGQELEDWVGSPGMWAME